MQQQQAAAAQSADQAAILASGIMRTGFNCILQRPTGAGKTWLAEQAIDAALGNGARAVYLLSLGGFLEKEEK